MADHVEKDVICYGWLTSGRCYMLKFWCCIFAQKILEDAARSIVVPHFGLLVKELLHQYTWSNREQTPSLLSIDARLILFISGLVGDCVLEHPPSGFFYYKFPLFLR